MGDFLYCFHMRVICADDTTLLCESKEDLMELLTRIQHLSKEKGLLLNTRKTKIMVVDRNRTDDHKFIVNALSMGKSWKR